MLITAAMLAAAVAGCASHPSTSTSPPTQNQKSYNAGYKVGEAISQPNETVAQMDTNCAGSEQQKMPSTDIKANWMDGCVAGIIQAEIQSGSSG
jgi:hypothetical protein